MKKKFDIQKEAHFTPVSIEKLAGELVLLSEQTSALSTSVLALGLKAWKSIQAHIGWAKETSDNQVEQGGILLGEAFIEIQPQRNLTLVHQVLAATSADGSMKHLHFSHQTWAELLGQADDFPHLQIVGWYHTHPKHLRVYMSETDKKTQALFFEKDWHFSLILNPQQQIIKAFQGKESEQTDVFLWKG